METLLGCTFSPLKTAEKQSWFFYAVATPHFIVAQLPPQMLWDYIQYRFVYQFSTLSIFQQLISLPGR